MGGQTRYIVANWYERTRWLIEELPVAASLREEVFLYFSDGESRLKPVHDRHRYVHKY